MITVYFRKTYKQTNISFTFLNCIVVRPHDLCWLAEEHIRRMPPAQNLTKKGKAERKTIGENLFGRKEYSRISYETSRIVIQGSQHFTNNDT